MKEAKILFIDRDGTLCHEPADYQVDQVEKIRLLDRVIPALLELTQAGYRLVMISNQDGRGTDSFPEAAFAKCHDFILELFRSQGIVFDEVLICPHFADDRCDCRKPKLGLLLPYLRDTTWDRPRSAVIGDRPSDRELAAAMGLRFFQIDSPQVAGLNWTQIADRLLRSDRQATVQRSTRETSIELSLNLDQQEPIAITTGLGFFDHMLEQIAKHAGFSLVIRCQGDLDIDDHHAVEDVGLVLGAALKQALGDKRGLHRYGFAVPMDEAEAHVLVDLGGRPFSVFQAEFQREKVGQLSTEMVPHFFRSLAETLAANIHIRAQGANDHHIIEGIFKAFARALRQAIQKADGHQLPSTKGLL